MPGVAGMQGPQGVPGLNGNNGFQSGALAAAMSMPVWLERQENFAVAGGFGFDQYTPAFGVTVVGRINQHWSAFGGAAVDTQYGTWAGKVGGRVGW